MKTAMQELLEAYDECKTLYDFNDWLCNNEKRLLEKEREQVIDFAYGCTQHISWEDIENHYNKEYQKK